MNRDVNEKGLKLDKQNHLPLILTAASDALPAQQQFADLIACQAEIDPEALLSWELRQFININEWRTTTPLASLSTKNTQTKTRWRQ